MSGEKSKVPQAISLASGIFAGAAIGWRAGEAVGEQASHALQVSSDSVWTEQGISAELLPAFETVGLFGGAALGALIAREQPLETVMLAAVTLGSQFGYHDSMHGSAQATVTPAGPDSIAAPLSTGTALADESGEAATEAFHHLF